MGLQKAFKASLAVPPYYYSPPNFFLKLFPLSPFILVKNVDSKK
jgi:hypothetical protein